MAMGYKFLLLFSQCSYIVNYIAIGTYIAIIIYSYSYYYYYYCVGTQKRVLHTDMCSF